MYYVTMLRCWQHVRILVKTNHPYLRVKRHSWYQSLMSIIHRWRPYFLKPMVMIRLDAHIRTIVVLTGDKLTGFTFCIYFMQFIFCNDATTPRSEGKYPPAGWCESWTHPLKIRLAWGQSLSCGRVCVPVVWRPRNVLWSLPQDVNTFL
jgi:hypothetical protein